MHQNLRRIPFFGELPDDVLKVISTKLHLKHYRKGEVVFVEGGSGDSMYLIESGQVKVVSGTDEEEKIFAYLGPGNFFGEMALLLGEPRSATVKVDIDADLWVLHKADMVALLKQYPSIAVIISRELSRRLRETDKQLTKRREYRVVAVIGKNIEDLALSLARQTGERVLLFDLGGVRRSDLNVGALARSGVTLLDSKSTAYLIKGGLAESLGSLVEKYDRILLCVLPQKGEVAIKALELADVTVHIGSGHENWVEQMAIKGHWHMANEPTAIDRIARRIAQRVVGLALSSGGARGIAHIGVLRVLKEEGIPIDLMAGTSAGSLFGALYAAGLSLDEITDFALGMKDKVALSSLLWDFHLPPRSGLIRGRRTLDYIDKTLGYKTFSDLKIPLYIVAADIMSGEEVIFASGSVAEAVRASISVIGIFSPAFVQGRYLIDGGAVNPVPTSVLAQNGADIIIASSVISSLEEQARRQREKKKGSPPNFLGVVMNMMGIMEREIIKTRMIPVDVVINPRVEIYNSMEYDKAKEFIRLGEEAAQEEIDRIKELISPQRRGQQQDVGNTHSRVVLAGSGIPADGDGDNERKYLEREKRVQH
jgi:predicted acylesterase/phospholipase RssA/CRP-like cAMP-binding protein